MQVSNQLKVDVNLLRQRFEYDVESGTLIAKTNISGIRTHPNGYYVVTVGDVTLSASSVVWFLVHGEFPHGNLRYKDGNNKNNHIDNLYASNGIRIVRGRYEVRYGNKYLGQLHTFEEAQACRDAYLKKILRKAYANGQTT